ncbi:MAG: hypothetical protein IIT97_00830 [Mycoplasmataceae bacterium]|nr:hypothetical protein [Mycoplasmataceae bacterium]
MIKMEDTKWKVSYEFYDMIDSMIHDNHEQNQITSENDYKYELLKDILWSFIDNEPDVSNYEIQYNSQDCKATTIKNISIEKDNYILKFEFDNPKPLDHDKTIGWMKVDQTFDKYYSFDNSNKEKVTVICNPIAGDEIYGPSFYWPSDDTIANKAKELGYSNKELKINQERSM